MSTDPNARAAQNLQQQQPQQPSLTRIAAPIPHNMQPQQQQQQPLPNNGVMHQQQQINQQPPVQHVTYLSEGQPQAQPELQANLSTSLPPMNSQQPLPQQQLQYAQQDFQVQHQSMPIHQQQQPASEANNYSIISPGTSATSQQSTDYVKHRKRLSDQLQQLSSRLKGGPIPGAPNLGFTPTPAMIKAHEHMHTRVLEQEQQQGEHAPSFTRRPLYQFQVTKLRSWRSGYVRLLCLYDDKFSTICPDTHEVTNTWSYAVISEWLAIPKEKDTILLQVNADKLKFKCHNVVDRSLVLTALLFCKHNHEGSAGEEYPTFQSCSRQTRHGTRIQMSLEVAPHGLIERNTQTQKRIQTYRYTDILSVSFTADDNSGIVLHMHLPPQSSLKSLSKRSRLFFIQSSRRHGNGRSDLVTIMKDNYEKLGLELHVSESCSIQTWMDTRRSLGQGAGPIVFSENVTKITRRHDVTVVGPDQGWIGGNVRRRLAVTGRAFLLELDIGDGGVVACRRLSDLYALVRHGTDQNITLEFVDGTSRMYTLPNRDALLVSLLDAATSLGKNHTVHVTDVISGGYCLSSPFVDANAGIMSSPSNASSSGIFQTIAIPMHCLKQLYATSTAAFAFLSHSSEPSSGDKVGINVSDECNRVVEACREYNASVPPMGDGMPTSSSDKLVLGCVGALWGIVSKLLAAQPNASTTNNENVDNSTGNNNIGNMQERRRAELIACPLFQSLYRLSHAPAGFKGSVELTTLSDCIPLLMGIHDSFTQFWALRALGVLLSGPAVVADTTRDQQTELFVNKSVILQRGGVHLVDGLVSTLLEAASKQPDGQQQVSDLILMATSDILQSILCSHHNTTKPEHFTLFINSLAKGYRALLATLRCQTPFIIENTALLLQVLTMYAPHTSETIRDAALSSGIVLQHFHAAMFSPLEGQRFLSRYLCSLWMSGPPECVEKQLLNRMIPSGFIGYLNMPLLSRIEEGKLDEIERDEMKEGEEQKKEPSPNGQSESHDTEYLIATTAAGTNTARLRSRISIANAIGLEHSKPENFRIFFHVLTKDHALPDLIWNQQTRRELRITLESELQSVRRATDARGGIDCIAWNHQQFTVGYPSLREEVQVGSVYMRLWLQAGAGFIKTWQAPLRLYELLFRRFLCELDRNTPVTIMCIRCLERLYAIHASKIGTFADIMIMIRSMATTKSIETQHRLLALVATLLGVSTDEDKHGKINIPGNAEQLLNAESISQFCQFVAWAHTNSIQIGNLLTKVLGDPTVGSKGLLTDGTHSGPEGKPSDKPSETYVPEEALQQEAPDALCPPVWFVAPAGRIPPPSDKITGPFRVSDLMSMMESGDLFPHSLVTVAHVENYNDDDEESEFTRETNSVQETQIDTGKWRMVDQVWQLRWQLCTDGSKSGVYGPSEVGLLALRSLSRLVDLHKSVDSRNVPYYPIPIAKRLLCGLGRDSSSSGMVESDGGVFEAGVIIDQRDSLSIISQALLCNDHRVVEAASDLLFKLMQHNDEARSKVYLSGLFLFSCSYTGSNFLSLARLLDLTHLKQHFRSGFAAAAKESDLSMKDRSILGNVLPEGMLFILVKYGAKRFSEVFVGNFDTPEVIWNFEMRKHVVEMIRQHLGDFPKRLWQNTTAKYEYCPLPGVAYKRLEREMFCHNYYLANLCDEDRFSNWPILEPVEVFRACLEEWKRQMNRDEIKEEDELEEARRVLNLKTGDGGHELRKAYRTLARKYHPDKNPAGREMFETIQSAYESLLPIIEIGGKITASSLNSELNDLEEPDNSSEGLGGGMAQMQTMQLLLKTQVIIYKRYEEEMNKYKYPTYQMLLSCLQIPVSCQSMDVQSDPTAIITTCLVKAQRLEFVRTAVELVFQTCLVSPLNAEELVVEKGLSVLDSLLDFYIRAARHITDGKKVNEVRKNKLVSIESEKAILDIVSHIVHTISGVAFYENGRSAILALTDPARFCFNWTSCVHGNFVVARPGCDDARSIKHFALEGVANMARTSELQNFLIGSGIIWPLTRRLLGYDPTLEVASAPTDQDGVNVSQATSNAEARLSARALGMLCGVMKDPSLISPENSVLLNAMKLLLTNPIACMLRNKGTSQLLRTLNSNIETPVRIWNVNMREELSQFIETMDKERSGMGFRPIEDELKHITTSFKYRAIRDELVIAGVYIRVFNSTEGGREGLREISNTANFAKEIIMFIARSLNEDSDFCARSIALSPIMESQALLDSFEEKGEECIPVADAKFLMAVEALRLLVRIDGLIDDVLCDDNVQGSSVLLSLLELPQDSEAFEISTDTLALMSPKQIFANTVSRQGSLWRLLMVLERSDGESVMQPSDKRSGTRRQERGWSLLESLSSSPSIATSLVQSSGWLELLGILVGFAEFSKTWAARTGAAKTLSRLLWDTKTGSIAAPLLHRFLPVTLTVVLKEEGPDVMLKLFDGESETPELIWDATMRSELRKTIAEYLNSVLATRRENKPSGEEFIISPEARVRYKKLEDELYIGGVYVRLFLKEPTFHLRDPTTFLEMLLHRWTNELDTYSVSSEVDDIDHGSSSRVVTQASQDALQLVTSASIYLCNVHEALCDKLAEWGYMARSLSFIQSMLSRELIGTPLLSIIRLLHVASNRRVNVEALAITGEVDGKYGIVDCTMEAIGNDTLHPDCAFMVEMLKNIFNNALGDVQKARGNQGSSNVRPTVQQQNATMGVQQRPEELYENWPKDTARFHAMAPSPAPGLEPVSMSDDPLSHFMTLGPESTPPGQSQGQPNHNTQQSNGQVGARAPTQPNAIDARYPSQNTLHVHQTQIHEPISINQGQQQGVSTPQSNYVQSTATHQQQVNSIAYQMHHQGNQDYQSSSQQHQYLNHGTSNESRRNQVAENSHQANSQHIPPQGQHRLRVAMPQPQSYSAQSQQTFATRDMPLQHQTPVSTHPSPQKLQLQQQYPTQVVVANPPSYSAQSQQNFAVADISPQQHMIMRAQPSSQQLLSQGQYFTQGVDPNPSSYSAQSQQTFVTAGMPSKQPAPMVAHSSSQQLPPQGQHHTQGVDSSPPSYSAQSQQTFVTAGMPSQQQAPMMTHASSQQLPPQEQNPTEDVVTHPQSYLAHSQQTFASAGTEPQVTRVVSQPGEIMAASQQPQYHPTPTDGRGVDARSFSNNAMATLQLQPQPQQYRPKPSEGVGIDARSTPEPSVTAEHTSLRTPGAPGCAQGRPILLQAAITCKLAQFLVDTVLENPTLSNVKDPAATKVHAVELLKLLTMDPGYGMKFDLILGEIPAWKKYRSQDHSLFITGLEQKSDYFLTNGDQKETQMLIQGKEKSKE